MRNTLEQFDEIVDGTLDQKTKLLCVYSIKYHLREKYVKFDDGEQRWYSETYPDDPSLAQAQTQATETTATAKNKSKRLKKN